MLLKPIEENYFTGAWEPESQIVNNILSSLLKQKTGLKGTVCTGTIKMIFKN